MVKLGGDDHFDDHDVGHLFSLQGSVLAGALDSAVSRVSGCSPRPSLPRDRTTSFVRGGCSRAAHSQRTTNMDVIQTVLLLGQASSSAPGARTKAYALASSFPGSSSFRPASSWVSHARHGMSRLSFSAVVRAALAAFLADLTASSARLRESGRRSVQAATGQRGGHGRPALSRPPSRSRRLRELKHFSAWSS